MRTLLLCALLSTFALHAAERTGRWSGSFDVTNEQGESRADTAYMELKESAVRSPALLAPMRINNGLSEKESWTARS